MPAGVDPRPPNAPTQTAGVPGQTRAPESKANVAFDVVTVAEGLEKPWGLAFLPGGKMLVTEKGTGTSSRRRVVDGRQALAAGRGRAAGGRARPGRTARRVAATRASRRTS